MRESSRESIEEATDFAGGGPNELTVRTYDLRRAPFFKEREIKAVREKFGVFRAVFADILDVSVRTAEKREIDGAEPNGSARKLIQLIEHNSVLTIGEIKKVSVS